MLCPWRKLPQCLFWGWPACMPPSWFPLLPACRRQTLPLTLVDTWVPNPGLPIRLFCNSAAPVSARAGLDARAANIVMRVVRAIADTGRTIVCTIHQPAIDIFEVRAPRLCPGQHPAHGAGVLQQPSL